MNKSFIKNLLVLCMVILFTNSILHSAGNFDQTDKEAPDFKLETLNGRDSVMLSSLRGSVVLVDFWASWCPPCAKSLPLLVKLEQKYKNLAVVTVNIDDDKENARQFLQKLNVDLTVVYDAEKKVVSVYNVPELPSAYLIDQYGKIKLVHSAYDEEQVKKLEFTIRGLMDIK
jgi:thiol-disulfide isomerase/thioredoxin